MLVYTLIPEEMYKELSSTVKLNAFLRRFFSKINTLDEIDELLEEAQAIRNAFLMFQPAMLKKLKTTSILSNLPLVLIRDKNRSGSKFLRWRFFQTNNNKCGTVAFDSIVLNEGFEKDLRLALIEAEKERVILNMQMSVLTQMVNQIIKVQNRLRVIKNLEEDLNK